MAKVVKCYPNNQVSSYIRDVIKDWKWITEDGKQLVLKELDSWAEVRRRSVTANINVGARAVKAINIVQAEKDSYRRCIQRHTRHNSLPSSRGLIEASAAILCIVHGNPKVMNFRGPKSKSANSEWFESCIANIKSQKFPNAGRTVFQHLGLNHEDMLFTVKGGDENGDGDGDGDSLRSDRSMALYERQDEAESKDPSNPSLEHPGLYDSDDDDPNQDEPVNEQANTIRRPTTVFATSPETNAEASTIAYIASDNDFAQRPQDGSVRCGQALESRKVREQDSKSLREALQRLKKDHEEMVLSNNADIATIEQFRPQMNHEDSRREKQPAEAQQVTTTNTDQSSASGSAMAKAKQAGATALPEKEVGIAADSGSTAHYNLLQAEKAVLRPRTLETKYDTRDAEFTELMNAASEVFFKNDKKFREEAHRAKQEHETAMQELRASNRELESANQKLKIELEKLREDARRTDSTTASAALDSSSTHKDPAIAGASPGERKRTRSSASPSSEGKRIKAFRHRVPEIAMGRVGSDSTAGSSASIKNRPMLDHAAVSCGPSRIPISSTPSEMGGLNELRSQDRHYGSMGSESSLGGQYGGQDSQNWAGWSGRGHQVGQGGWADRGSADLHKGHNNRYIAAGFYGKDHQAHRNGSGSASGYSYTPGNFNDYRGGLVPGQGFYSASPPGSSLPLNPDLAHGLPTHGLPVNTLNSGRPGPSVIPGDSFAGTGYSGRPSRSHAFNNYRSFDPSPMNGHASNRNSDAPSMDHMATGAIADDN